MTERHLDFDLRELKAELLRMGGNVERAIELASEALLKWEPSKIASVHEIENKINQAHLVVDEKCIEVIALQQPIAADLRLIVSILKISTDLERMGDQAVNIAWNSEKYLKGTPLKPLIDLPIMSQAVKKMVRDALDAFVQSSEQKAREVLLQDDAVDALKHQIFKDVIELIKKDTNGVEQGLSLILIARNLERIGDHATNIAEDVIYAISGKDVRHSKGGAQP